jgi:hypothetical protein
VGDEMNAYRDIKTGRRLIWAGIIFVVSMALAIASYMSQDGSALKALAVLAFMSIPAALALLALDRRPSLLTAAAMSALVQGVLLLTSGLGLLQVIPAILWYLAGQKRPRAAAAPTWATWARPLLAVATLLPLVVMFSHLDPICKVTDAGGTVVSSEVDTNAPSGWALSLGGLTSSSTDTDSDGVTRSCTSDTVRPWESALSLAVSALIVGLATRWPTGTRLIEESEPSSASGRPA